MRKITIFFMGIMIFEGFPMRFFCYSTSPNALLISHTPNSPRPHLMWCSTLFVYIQFKEFGTMKLKSISLSGENE